MRKRWLLISALLHGVTIAVLPAPPGSVRAPAAVAPPSVSPAEEEPPRRDGAGTSDEDRGEDDPGCPSGQCRPDPRRARVDRAGGKAARIEVVRIARPTPAPEPPARESPDADRQLAGIVKPEARDRGAGEDSDPEDGAGSGARGEDRRKRATRRRDRESPPEVVAVDGFVHYVPVAEAVGVGTVPYTSYVSAFDAVAPEQRRPEVTDAVAGPLLDGVASKPLGAPARVRAPNPGPSATGSGDDAPSRKPGDADPQQIAGHDATATATPTRAGPPPSEARAAEDAPTPSEGRRAGSPPAVPAQPAPPVRAGGDPDLDVPAAPAADRPAAVFRGAIASAPSPVGDAPAQGGAIDQVEVVARPVEPREEDPVPAEDVPARADAPIDAVADAREPVPDARGDAERDVRSTTDSELRRDARATGRPNPSRLAEPYAPAHSPQAAFDDPSPVSDVQVSARKTDLGVWTQVVDAEIRGRWMDTDLPIEDLAFGLAGVVMIEVSVARNGRVRDVRVLVESGYPQLDAWAQLAVPDRLERPPDGALVHRIVFRYRNGVVTTR